MYVDVDTCAAPQPLVDKNRLASSKPFGWTILEKVARSKRKRGPGLRDARLQNLERRVFSAGSETNCRSRLRQ
jgi:hypothetical protein